MKAVVLLIVAGFLGGFVLSSGSGRLFHFVHSASAGQSIEDGTDFHFTLDQKGGRQGTMVQGGGGPVAPPGGAGNAAGGQGGTAKPRKDLRAEAEGPQSDPPPGGDPLQGEKAMAFLAGNTVQIARGADKTVLRFMSPHGWQADREDGSPAIMAHRWILRGQSLCEFTTSGVGCDVVTITIEPHPKAGVGAIVGHLSLPDRKIERPVLRGNVANVPESLPLIAGEPLPVLSSGPPGAGRRGQGTVEAMLDRPLLVREPSRALRALIYRRNGELIDVRPLQAGAKSGLAGVRLSVGHWDRTESGLCEDGSGPGALRECFTPEQGDDGIFRLRRSTGAARTLQVIAEAK